MHYNHTPFKRINLPTPKFALSTALDARRANAFYNNDFGVVMGRVATKPYPKLEFIVMYLGLASLSGLSNARGADEVVLRRWVKGLMWGVICATWGKGIYVVGYYVGTREKREKREKKEGWGVMEGM